MASSAQALVKIESSTDSAHNTWNPVSEMKARLMTGLSVMTALLTGLFLMLCLALSRSGWVVFRGISAASDNDFKIVGSLEVSAPRPRLTGLSALPERFLERAERDIA